MSRRATSPTFLAGAQARELRAHMSPPEIVLWLYLRARRTGFQFHRQRPIGPYIADFYCHPARLVVEVDGIMHRLRGAHDAVRDRWMSDNHIETLRVPAASVMEGAEHVAQSIKNACERRCRERGVVLAPRRVCGTSPAAQSGGTPSVQSNGVGA